MTYTCDIHRDNVYGVPRDAWRVVLDITCDPDGSEEYDVTSARIYERAVPQPGDSPSRVDLVDLLHEDVIHDLRREAITAWEDDGECDQAGYPEGMDGGRDDGTWIEGRDGLD